MIRRFPKHTLHIYKKPREAISGSSGSPVISDENILSLEALNYKHTITYHGGFDTAECVVSVPEALGDRIFSRMLGNRVKVVVDDSENPAWEGYINTVTIEKGSAEYTRSLEKMMNYVYVIYSQANVSPSVQETTAVPSAASRAVYGTKVGYRDAGETYRASTIVTALRNLYLADFAWPVPSHKRVNGSGYKVTISMKGFFHTLAWERFISTSTTTSTAGTQMLHWMNNGFNVGSVAGNGWGIFYNSVDSTQVQVNTAFNVARERRLGTSNLDSMKQIAEAGDGVDKWVFGITPTISGLGYRRLYYQPANQEITLRTSTKRGGQIYLYNGRKARPWAVRPDTRIYIDDVLPGWAGVGKDPRIPYVTRIIYDANAEQPVEYVGEDDFTLDGAFNLLEHSKSVGSAFANDRKSYS